MVAIEVTRQMVGTTAEIAVRLLQKSGLSLIVYKSAPVEDFIVDILSKVESLQRSVKTDSGMLEVEGEGYQLYWVPLRTEGGTVAVFMPFMAERGAGAGLSAQHYRINYLDPIVNLRTAGYEVSSANLGDTEDANIAAKVQSAYI